MQSQIIQGLRERITAQQQSIAKMKAAIRAAESGRFHYSIHLISLWADAGEKSLELSGKHLRTLFDTACTTFKEMNNRSDIQASMIVKVHVGELSYPIYNGPPEFQGEWE